MLRSSQRLIGIAFQGVDIAGMRRCELASQPDTDLSIRLPWLSKYCRYFYWYVIMHWLFCALWPLSWPITCRSLPYDAISSHESDICTIYTIIHRPSMPVQTCISSCISSDPDFNVCAFISSLWNVKAQHLTITGTPLENDPVKMVSLLVIYTLLFILLSYWR